MLGQFDTTTTDISQSTWDTLLTDPYSLAQASADQTVADVTPTVSSAPTLSQDLSMLGQFVQFGGQVYQYVQGTQNGQPVAHPVVVQQVAPGAPTGKILGLTPTQLLVGGGILAAFWLFA